MTGDWFIRVLGKEYGPVDFDTMREWAAEGRLIPENEIREADSSQWSPASEVPNLFPVETAPAPSSPTAPRSFGKLLQDSWRIYCRGFGKFFALTALVLVPRICAQLSAIQMAPDTTVDLDLRGAVAALFNLTMLGLSFAAWPVYLAGIQILTAELAEHRAPAFRDLVSRALRPWPRLAILCLLVYGALILLTALAFAILLLVLTGGDSLVIALVSLGLLALQVWMFSRVYSDVLFWQPAAVLEDAGVVQALRRSKALGRLRDGLPWYRRPVWRAAFVVSLWCIFVGALTIGPQWTVLTRDFQTLTTIHDPQRIAEMFRAQSRASGIDWLSFGVDAVQAILRPLLGIAFVLLYFEAKPRL